MSQHIQANQLHSQSLYAHEHSKKQHTIGRDVTQETAISSSILRLRKEGLIGNDIVQDSRLNHRRNIDVLQLENIRNNSQQLILNSIIMSVGITRIDHNQIANHIRIIERLRLYFIRYTELNIPVRPRI